MTPEQEEMWKTLNTSAEELRRRYNEGELGRLIREKIRAAAERADEAYFDRCYTAKKKDD
jgi:hypothetical protein